MVFKLDGDIIFFLSFDDHFSHQSLAMRAKVQQGAETVLRYFPDIT